MVDQSEFRREVEGQRTYLLRYASLQLRNPAAAEDAVQDTLVAALAGESGFAGRSNLRTWLTGILKHKIIDAIRKASRETTLQEDDEESGESAFDALFKANGHWHDAPAAWEQPEQALESRQFMRALEECLTRLPARTGQVFMMREHLGIDTETICQETGVTSTHCWVLLYRARMALQQCLQAHWFGR